MTTHPSAGGVRPSTGPTARRLTISAPSATEAEYTTTIIEAAQTCGWMVAHFRPCKTQHGWRTAVQGDGAGFPDLVLVHPAAGLLLVVELKRRGNKPTVEQLRWLEALLEAGVDARLLYVPAQLDAFVQELADRARPS